MSSPNLRRGLLAGVVVALLLVPFLFNEDQDLIGQGLFAMSAAIAAIGLVVLTGITGQLSLGHAFFVALGAYGYCYLASDAPTAQLADTQPGGLGLPTVLALVLAVFIGGFAGALFSPIAGRLRGIYLGLASLGLVFIGQHLWLNIPDVTGGFNGRPGPAIEIFGFSFSDSDPDLSIGDKTFGQLERLWYLGMVLVALSWWASKNLIHSRPGRALQAVRDSEISAGAMGIDVRLYKAAAFTVSSMFAALGGVFFALTISVIPENFGFLQSIDYLVIVVIGGLASPGGAVAAAGAIYLVRFLLDKNADSLPLVADPGAEGLTADEASRFIYGAAVILILIYAPRGLAGLSGRGKNKRSTPSSNISTTRESTT